jgi:ACR3 family arsenite efflux pump ArsB
MTAAEHNKTLATLYLIYGAMHGLTLVGLLLLVIAVFATPAANSISSFWLACGLVTFLALVFLVGLLPLALGYALRKRRRWAKPLGVSLAVASMINIPIGTALGIYTIKFFRSEGGVVLYGGKSSTVAHDELQEALRGAQPLMNWDNRSKSDQNEQKV